MSVEFCTCPVVFAVKDEYQIMIPVKSELLMWVEIGGEKYFDEVNGIIRSSKNIHKFTVPMSELDKAKGYDVCYRKVIERKPYRTETEEAVSVHFDFNPVPTDREIKLYHISDTHGNREKPVAAAKFFGNIDLLVLNGDIIDHSGEEKNFMVIYEICSDITGGSIPCIFSRGNHDLRGVCADKLTDWSPTDNGNTYFTFRLGKIWGLVVDGGEDKIDEHIEYGHTICCHAFRLRQTKFIEKICASKEYEADGIEYKLVIAHNPFTWDDPSPEFNIERDIYLKWCELVRENIKPDLMLCGHLHRTEIFEVGGPNDNRGQACPVIIGSDIKRSENGVHFTAAGVTLEGKNAKVVFNDNESIKFETNITL